MSLVDSHCHLDDPRFDADREAVLERARAAGVAALVVPAVRESAWSPLARLCRGDPGLHPALGLHPMFLAPGDEDALDRLPAALAQSGAVAVGECGLDFRDGMPPRELQERVLARQLDIARETGLPVILHAVRAVEAVIGMLRARPGLRGVVHSWSGSPEQAAQLQQLGFLLGVGGPVTRPGAKRLRASVAAMPLSQLLLETDAPDQPDQAWLGQRNEPCRLPGVLAEVARLRGEPETMVAEASVANARRLFGLDAPRPARDRQPP